MSNSVLARIEDGFAPPNPPNGMAYVPGGDVPMGSNTGDVYERPEHNAVVKSFFIDVYEVTCNEYEKFLLAENHAAPPSWVNGRPAPGYGRKPVTGVSWDDANAYARWAAKRLPTEEEWELAARGNDGRRYPWGNEWKKGSANADTSAHGHGGVAVVGEHKGASPYGLFDIVGNAWEWTASTLAAYPGGQLPPSQGEMKVIRGGCWTDARQHATTTRRMGLPPRGGAYDNIGFRCAKDVP